MRSVPPAASPRRRAAAAAVLLAVAFAIVLGACAPAAPADGPGAVVNDALAKVAAKDLDGLRGLACAGQEDLIRDQLGLAGAGAGADLLPGLDMDALLGAVTLDVRGVTLGDAVIDGDVAQVPVGGNVKVTFDAVTLKPIVKQLLARQGGSSMTDQQLDDLLASLAAYGQDVPLDQTVRLVRESGTWKICQEALKPPVASPAGS